MSIELEVKSKGELFLPKRFRKEQDINVGDVFRVTIEKGKIVLEKKVKLFDLLDLPPLTRPFSHSEITEDIREEIDYQMDISD